jgi:hypothetical protein
MEPFETAAQHNARHGMGHHEHKLHHPSDLHHPPSLAPGDDVLKESAVRLDRKQFLISARRNRNGAFIRIDELRMTHNHHAPNRIIIPQEGAAKFLAQLAEVMKELDGK